MIVTLESSACEPSADATWYFANRHHQLSGGSGTLQCSPGEGVPQDSPIDAQELLETVLRPLLFVHSSTILFSEAIRLQERYRLSWYDSLIVAAAQQAGCKLLYSEDLQHGQQFGPVTIHNPFL